MSALRVQIRDLKAHLSRYLAEARAGRAIEVTSHRKVVARITGIPDTVTTGMADWLASGAAQWRGGKPAGARLHLSPGGKSLAQLLDDERG